MALPVYNGFVEDVVDECIHDLLNQAGLYRAEIGTEGIVFETRKCLFKVLFFIEFVHELHFNTNGQPVERGLFVALYGNGLGGVSGDGSFDTQVATSVCDFERSL